MEYILILMTAIVWGVAPVFDKIALKTVEPAMALAIRMTASGVILFCYLIFAGRAKNVLNISVSAGSAILTSAVLSGVLGYIFYFKALSGGNVSKVVPMVATYPLVASIIAIAFLGESFSIVKFTGIILIVAGLMVLNIK